MRNVKVTFLFITLLFSSLVFSDEVLTFKSAEQEQLYHELIQELRCPKCLNQSIADSHAGISEDLRNLVYEKVIAGETKRDIKVFLKERYGDFILYQPEVEGANLVLWYGPVVAIIFIVFVLWFRFKSKSSSSIDNELDESESERLSALLSDTTSDKGSK